MTDKEILAAALEKTGKKQADIAREFGVSRSTVSTNLRRDNMGVGVFIKYLNHFGYTVMVGEKNGDEFTPIWELEQGD